MLVFSGETGWTAPETSYGMGTENSSLDDSKPMVLMLGDFYLFQFHSDFKCKSSSRVCYKERQKKIMPHSLSPLFFGFDDLISSPQTSPLAFPGHCWYMSWNGVLAMPNSRPFALPTTGVFNPPSSLFGFREGNTGKTSDHGGWDSYGKGQPINYPKIYDTPIIGYHRHCSVPLVVPQVVFVGQEVVECASFLATKGAKLSIDTWSDGSSCGK